MKKCFLADPHLSHDSIGITFRNFATIEEHNECILDGINRTADVNDLIYLLGDFCWHGEESWLRRIRCKNIHLIIGNHDRAKLGKLCKTAQDVAEIKLKGHRVFLSHYPHAYWPGSHHGSLHLYGHVHSQREATLDAAFPGRRSMDVGVDNAFLLLGAYRPFTEDEVLDILLKRPGHDQVEFYRNLQAQRKRETE